MKIRKSVLTSLHQDYLNRSSQQLLEKASRVQIQKPNSIIARVYTARALRMSGQFLHAAQILETIILPFPKLAKIYLEYLFCLQSARSFSQWEVQAQRFLTFHYHEKVARKLGTLLLKQKQWNRACYYFIKVSENGKTDSSLNFKIGLCYFYLGNFLEAQKYLIRSSFFKSRYYLARILHDQGAYLDAVAQLQGIEEGHRSGRYFHLLAKLYRKTENKEGEMLALENLYTFTSTKDIKIRILKRMEILCAFLHDQELTIGILLRQISLNPGVYLYEKIANFFMQEAKYAQAQEYYQKGLSLCPDHPRLISGLFECYSYQSLDEKAAEILKRGFLCRVNPPENNLKLAETLFRLQRFEECKQVLESMAGESDFRSRVWFLLSRVHGYLGQTMISQYYKGLYESVC